MFEVAGLGVDDRWPGDDRSVGEVLLTTHRSYLPAIRPLLASGVIRGMAHITGGGITDNLPRVLPEGLQARVARASWDVPPMFQWLQTTGSVSDEDMRRSFNMGIGLIVVCAPGDADALLASLAAESPRVIGSITPGDRGVVYV